jgi:ATP-dependent helicase/nuclease subunit A
MADGKLIWGFFATELGAKLRRGGQVLREFKFSVLDRGENFDPALQGEEILLQGVVDCALVEEDGITVVDFKTDRVTEETLPAVAERYRQQVQTYAEAMARIWCRPVKAALLYFFRLSRFVAVDKE